MFQKVNIYINDARKLQGTNRIKQAKFFQISSQKLFVSQEVNLIVTTRFFLMYWRRREIIRVLTYLLGWVLLDEHFILRACMHRWCIRLQDNFLG